MTNLQDLCAELICGDDTRAEQAALQLPGYGEEALDVLSQLFVTGQEDERWWVVRALAGFSANDQITSLLMTALADGSENIRQAAAMAFCHMPDPKSLTSLATALQDPDPMTARLVANAMLLLGNQASPFLVDILKNSSPNARIEAARALAEIKDPATIPDLIKAYESGSALVQYWSGLGLELMGVGMVYLKPE